VNGDDSPSIGSRRRTYRSEMSSGSLAYCIQLRFDSVAFLLEQKLQDGLQRARTKSLGWHVSSS
jgi:hypothetical protein